MKTVTHLLLCCILLSACATAQVTFKEPEGNISRIAFGSCASQNKPQPILTTATQDQPDLFIFLGDNIYGDTEKMKKLEKKYHKLGRKDEFQALNEATTILATWDDHDYGVNDGGLEYPKKVESKEVFMKFWDEPEDGFRRTHEGIYTSYLYGETGKRTQIILLDTRTFRTNLLPAETSDHRNDYRPNPDPNATLLGQQQWEWLEQELQVPAEVRIIGSSTQFGIEYNGYEAWANFPLEQERMFDLIKSTQANGVIFITGDVHYGELSIQQPTDMYPIHDVTSSGITQTWSHVEANSFRLGEAFRENNYGLIIIDWEANTPTVRMTVRDVLGNEQIQHEIPLDSLRF